MRSAPLALLLFSLALPLAASGEAPPAPDALDAALARGGLARPDLGIRPDGTWLRFPLPRKVPHLLPFFSDLYARPLAGYEMAAAMGYAARQFLDPASKDPQALHRALFNLAVGRLAPAFRDYSTNLDRRPAARVPLAEAIERLVEAAGGTLDQRSFGKEPDFPRPRADLARAVEALPKGLEPILSRLVMDTADVYRWTMRARRRVGADLALRLFALRDLAETVTDGTRYDPEVDDAAARLDLESLLYAGMKGVQALEDARRDLEAWLQQAGSGPELKKLAFAWSTPAGWIVFAGTGDDVHERDRPLVVVDLGGNDVYRGAYGAAGAADHPVGLVLDLAGDDRYVAREAPSQGAAILGVGVLLDAAGRDRYEAARMAQGAALFGVGVLVDRGGDDAYRVGVSGQGAAYFGVGALLDLGGNDAYHADGDAQGFGGPGGVGVLADRSGNDRYRAEPDAARTGRPDYHSQGKISVSNAQGVGSGRRADGSDGHSWAGGLGALVDVAGDDHYVAGNFSLGTGYWFGTGVVWDGGGNDTYETVYFTLASTAHFAVGIFVDEAGDDQYRLSSTAGAALAFGWDFGVSLFVDGGGNDRYRAARSSFGVAQVRSRALFLELGGDDTYVVGPDSQVFGASDHRPDYAVPNPLAPYFYHDRCIGLFLDLGGKDAYRVEGKGVAEEPHGRAGDGKSWRWPAPGSREFGFKNDGLGADVEGGTVREIALWSAVLRSTK